MLLYSLLFTSIFNLILLFVLAVAIVRLGAVMYKLSLRANGFLDKGEKEIQSVGSAIKGTFSKSDQYVNAAVKVSERFLAYKALNRVVSSPRPTRAVMGLGIAFGLLSVLSKKGKKK